MATLYESDNTKRSKAGKMLSWGEHNGRVKICHDSIKLEKDLQVNDEVTGPRLPRGARIIGAEIYSPSLGTTGTVSMGLRAHKNGAGTAVEENAASLIKAHAAKSAAKHTRMDTEAGMCATVGEETDVFLKCTEVTQAGTGVTIDYIVLYVLD